MAEYLRDPPQPRRDRPAGRFAAGLHRDRSQPARVRRAAPRQRLGQAARAADQGRQAQSARSDARDAEATRVVEQAGDRRVRHRRGDVLGAQRRRGCRRRALSAPCVIALRPEPAGSRRAWRPASTSSERSAAVVGVGDSGGDIPVELARPASACRGSWDRCPAAKYSISIVLKTISTFCSTLPSSVALWFTLVMKASVISDGEELLAALARRSPCTSPA